MHGPRHPLDTRGRAARPLVRRRGIRGAMFVEAVIVISFMVLALTGLMYFKKLYGEQLRAMRVARAAAIAYAMGACQQNVNEPDDWIDKDRASLVSDTDKQQTDPDPRVQKAVNDNVKDESRRSVEESGLMEKIINKLNEIGVAAFSGEAKVQESRSALAGGNKDLFKGTVRSKSYASCGDRVREGSFDEMVQSIVDIFKSLY